MRSPIARDCARQGSGEPPASRPEIVDIVAALTALQMRTTEDSRIEWRRLYRTMPPTRLSRDLVIRGVAHIIQERVTAHWVGGAFETECGLAVIAGKEERARACRIAGGDEVPA